MLALLAASAAARVGREVAGLSYKGSRDHTALRSHLPFDDDNVPNLFRKIKGGVYTLPSYLSEGARHLISKMLSVDPLKRITLSGIWSLPPLGPHPQAAHLSARLHLA